MTSPQTFDRVRFVALVVIAGGSLVVGLWAVGFPPSFYDDFPGMGRVWVAVDGPYNEHLVRDVGALNLSIAFVALLALVTRSTLVARAAGGAALVYGVPHLAYHATNLDPFDTADAVGIIVSLTIAALAGLLAVLPSTSAAHSGQQRADEYEPERPVAEP